MNGPDDSHLRDFLSTDVESADEAEAVHTQLICFYLTYVEQKAETVFPSIFQAG